MPNKIMPTFVMDSSTDYSKPVCGTIKLAALRGVIKMNEEISQEKSLLREHIKLLAEKATKADTAADLQLLTSAICTAVVTLQNLT